MRSFQQFYTSFFTLCRVILAKLLLVLTAKIAKKIAQRQMIRNIFQSQSLGLTRQVHMLHAVMVVLCQFLISHGNFSRCTEKEAAKRCSFADMIEAERKCVIFYDAELIIRNSSFVSKMLKFISFGG